MNCDSSRYNYTLILKGQMSTLQSSNSIKSALKADELKNRVSK